MSCNKEYSNKIYEESQNRFKNTFKFSNNNINKFILLLKKSVFPYEYIDELDKLNETLLPEKKKKSFIVTKVCKIFQSHFTITQR